MTGRTLGDTAAHVDASASVEYLRPMSTSRRIAYLLGMVMVAALLSIAGVQTVNALMGWL